MRFNRKIAPEFKPRQSFITKKRLREDEIDFDKLRSYRLDRVRKELEKRQVREDINIPIKVGDVVKGGKFKNKSIKVKKIGKNEKGDITINDKPLLKVRIPNENN